MYRANLLVELGWPPLLEGGGHGDVGHDGHGVPLLGLLAGVQGLGGEARIVCSVARHLGRICSSAMQTWRMGETWNTTGGLKSGLEK